MSDTKSIQRTSSGLAEAMFRELENLEQGNSTPQAARAKSSVANTIIGLTRLEMDYARFVADARAAENRTASNIESRSLPALILGGTPAK